MYIKIALAALIVLFCSVVFYLSRIQTVQDGIKIYFPLTVLKNGPELLDPTNTETVWEYYLLENLSCGLIRDSLNSPSGYEGCLSDRFFQESSRTWVFQIRQLKWSDGSTVSDDEIRSWITDLLTRQSRHVKLLRLVDHFDFDKSSRFLRLNFVEDVDDGILHELSLADAALVPTNYRNEGWKKTVGPYSVSKWTDSNGELKLTANKFSPFYSKDMPQEVTLFWISDPVKRLELFKSIKVDIVPQTATASPIPLAQIRANAAQEYVAHPTSILFFYFNRQNELSLKTENREAFATVIREFQASYQAKLSKAYRWNAETQMIPEGFSGRLPNDTTPVISSGNGGLPEKLEITLFENFKELPEFTQGLISAFKVRKIDLEIKFSNDPKLSKSTFASLYVFVGNQLNSSGSWSFLLSSPHGMLSPWVGEFKSQYEAVFDIAKISDRNKNLDRLHSEILAKYIAVPTEVGSIRYFMSDRIDCKRWNKFDSRLRIYELRERGHL